MSAVVATADQASLGVLVSTVRRDVVDLAVAANGKQAKRKGGTLPPHVTAYLTMALWLFPDDDYAEIITKVTGSLSVWGCWDASWPVPTPSAFTQARKRLGSKVSRDVFEGVAQAVGTMFTRGVWLRKWRMTAIDGFEVDVYDSEENATEFGYSGSGDKRSAFPKARVVAISECGAHVFLAAEVVPLSVGEKTAAARLLTKLLPDEMLTADRNFYSFEAWTTATRTGAALLWRAPTGLRLPMIGDPLSDGTYLSVLVNPKYRGKRRDAVIAAAEAGEEIAPEDGHVVRVVEYDVPDREGNGTGELIVLLTNILDPGDAGADELASGYHERWEIETANDQLKTHLRGPGRVLKSQLPELVYQEIWGWLTLHYALAALIVRAADAADIDPDRVSFTRALRIVRRTATGTAAFPP